MKELKQKYQEYLWDCHNQGDIWHIDYRPYTFEEWLTYDKPKTGGLKIKKNNYVYN